MKHIKGVWQACTKHLEQIELELVATVGQGVRLDEAGVDDCHVRLCAQHSAELIMLNNKYPFNWFASCQTGDRTWQRC